MNKAGRFGKKIAKVMKDLSSSHVYFIIQQAYKSKRWGKNSELMSWQDAMKILDDVINEEVEDDKR